MDRFQKPQIKVNSRLKYAQFPTSDKNGHLLNKKMLKYKLGVILFM
jgi:hypothetical protein